jgi:meiotic recombination protein SPO11
MQLIYDVLRKRIHITKRDLFYTDVKLFQDQARAS